MTVDIESRRTFTFGLRYGPYGITYVTWTQTMLDRYVVSSGIALDRVCMTSLTTARSAFLTCNDSQVHIPTTAGIGGRNT